MKKTCSFLGHRIIEITPWLIENIRVCVGQLIELGVSEFLFGSKSQFVDLCLKIVSEFKAKFPYIKRVYVRAEYENISESYEKYLLESYDETYFPEKIKNAGKSSYVKRNFEMIEKSDVCVFYYNPSFLPPIKCKKGWGNLINQPKSGTKIAFEYATRKNKKIINLFKDFNCLKE